MVYDTTYDQESSAEISSIPVMRCANCGNVEDQLILGNRITPIKYKERNR